MEVETTLHGRKKATSLVEKTVYSILFSISFAHLLNDLIQAIIPSIYPLLKESYNLTFSQIGLITFAFQFSASMFQPLVGYYTDKNPKPFSQIYGMFFSMAGIISISYANNFYWIILSVILIGTGSSIFHPEPARISNLASGGKRGSEQPTLDRRRAGTDELQLIVAPDHPLAGEKSVRAEQLVMYPLIHREPGNAIRDLVDQFFASAGIPFEDLNVTAELGSLSTVKHMVAKGFGVAIASAAAIRSAVRAGRLVGIPLEPRLYTPLEVIVLKDKIRSRLVNTFADFVTEEIVRMSSATKN